MMRIDLRVFDSNQEFRPIEPAHFEPQGADKRTFALRHVFCNVNSSETVFAAVWGFAGGVLIGIASVLLMLLIGRIGIGVPLGHALIPPQARRRRARLLGKRSD
jgi:hypothetical protein